MFHFIIDNEPQTYKRISCCMVGSFNFYTQFQVILGYSSPNLLNRKDKCVHRENPQTTDNDELSGAYLKQRFSILSCTISLYLHKDLKENKIFIGKLSSLMAHDFHSSLQILLGNVNIHFFFHSSRPFYREKQPLSQGLGYRYIIFHVEIV